MDMVTIYAVTINNMFAAKDAGRPLIEPEFLYYQSCLDFMVEVNRLKTMDLRFQIERIENGQSPIFGTDPNSKPEPKPKETKDSGEEGEEGSVPEGH